MHGAPQRRGTRARLRPEQEDGRERSGAKRAQEITRATSRNRRFPIRFMKSLFTLAPKLLIGVVHLRPLPGAPQFGGSLSDILKAAVTDAVAYERGGAHAVIVENFGDVPFTKSSVAPE